MENKTFWLLVGSNLLSIILVVGGVLLAFNHIGGWGWLIFAALVVYGSPKITVKNKKDEKPKTEK